MNKPGQGKAEPGKPAHDKPAQDKPEDAKAGLDRQKTVERVVTGLAGAAFEGLETVEGGVAALWNLNKAVLRTAGKVTEPLRKPLDALGVTELVGRPVEAIAHNVEETVARLEEKGRVGLAQTGQITVEAIGSTVGGTVDAVLAYLTSNPRVDALISAQVERLLPLLASHPAVEDLVRKKVAAILPQLKEDPDVRALIQAQAAAYLANAQKTLDPTLQGLIRQQGDAYIDYLNAHPTAVQTLVQGQSMNLANEVMNEVRERSVTADSLAELIARRLLGRKQRADLPPPPVEVQRRAETSRIPSDFFVAPTPTIEPAPQLAPPTPEAQLAPLAEDSAQPELRQFGRSNGHA